MSAARRAMWTIGAVLLAFAGTWTGTARAEAQDPRMVEIVEMIRTGKGGDAVVLADRMIAGFVAVQHEPGVAYFCNRDRGGVANLLDAGRRGAKVDLAPEAWCEALFARGFALSAMKRYDEAAAALAQAVAMDPSNPHFLNQYADVLRFKGDGAGAMVAYRKAYQLAAQEKTQATAPMATRALRGLALASESAGDLSGAQGCYEQLLAQDASDAEARAGLTKIVQKRTAGR